MKDPDTIRYESENGYSGMIYGISSLSVCDKDGNEVMHTGFRSINTLDELKELVDGYPELQEKLRDVFPQEKESRYLAMKSPEDKTWYLYDNDNDIYVLPPQNILDELKFQENKLGHTKVAIKACERILYRDVRKKAEWITDPNNFVCGL